TRMQPGPCFLPGLLHDIGRAVFLLSNSAPLEVVETLVARGEGDAATLEAEWYGFDHTAASSLLAQEWGVAPAACDAVRWHHDPDGADLRRAMAEILHVADRLAYQAGLGTSATPPSVCATPMVPLSPDEEARLVVTVKTAFDTQRGLFQ